MRSTAVMPNPTGFAGSAYPRLVSARPLQEPMSLDDRFAAGDESSLREAFEKWGAAVYTFCRRSLPDDLAQEAMQDVFVDAWRKRERFDPERGTVISWLMGIARNRVIDRHRAESRHSRRRDATDVHEDHELLDVDDARSTGDHVADRIVVADALDRLPDRAKQVIRFAYFDRLSHAEIAERTGIPLGTVKSDIARGLERIRRDLETHDD